MIDKNIIVDELLPAVERMIQLAIPDFKLPDGTRDEKCDYLEAWLDRTFPPRNA